MSGAIPTPEKSNSSPVRSGFARDFYEGTRETARMPFGLPETGRGQSGSPVRIPTRSASTPTRSNRRVTWRHSNPQDLDGD
jgi:hypothetical protein